MKHVDIEVSLRNVMADAVPVIQHKFPNYRIVRIEEHGTEGCLKRDTMDPYECDIQWVFHLQKTDAAEVGPSKMEAMLCPVTEIILPAIPEYEEVMVSAVTKEGQPVRNDNIGSLPTTIDVPEIECTAIDARLFFYGEIERQA